MARGGRFAYDPTPMPVLAISPSRGDRFAVLMGAQYHAEDYRPLAQGAVVEKFGTLATTTPHMD